LKYIYANSITAAKLKEWDFELEHLVPLKKLKTMIPPGDEDAGLPINAVANLALIPKYLNREKSELTVYQYIDWLVSSGKKTQVEADELTKEFERYTLTTRADLDFVTSDLTEEKYRQFLKSRFEKLKDIFFKLNEIV
jgi:hypothetical protein